MVAYPAPYTVTASFDISFVDPTTHAYYLADRTNAGVAMVNTTTDAFAGVLGAGDFAGASPTVTAAQTKACGTGEAGPNGVLALNIDGVDQVWAGDGVTAAAPVSSVKVFTMTSGTSGTLAATIATGDATFGTTGTCRADEMAYDPVDHIFAVANDDDTPPYITLISVNANLTSDHVIGQLKFANATAGIEQTVYDAQTGKFYSNIPGVELAAINPTTASVVATYAQPNCTSAGLALDPSNQTLMVGCAINADGSMLMSVRTGAVLARFPQVSGEDENWYDPGTNAFYLGANHMTSNGNTNGVATPVIGVISAGGNHGQRPFRTFGQDDVATWIENFATGATTNNTHSVAADPTNGQIFVPVAGSGIMVLADTPSSTGL